MELCTYLDRNYLLQGVALSRSLEHHAEAARLWVLCFDDYARRCLAQLELEGIVLVSADELLEWDPALRVARKNRPQIEFYYACTARLVKYVFARTSEADSVTYIDADMFLFDSLEPIYQEDRHANVIIVKHDSGNTKQEAEHGSFNVCFVYFRASGEAHRCLEWWADRTLESTAFTGGIWGDQKYLDEFPRLFEGVHVLRDPGSTLGPWNAWRPQLSHGDSGVLLDGVPLRLFHFARLLVLSRHLFIPIRREWLSKSVLRSIYRPYLHALRDAYDEVREFDPKYRVGYTSRNLRGAMLGLLFGRAFYEGRLGMWRLGVYLPSTRTEWRASRSARTAPAARRSE